MPEQYQQQLIGERRDALVVDGRLLEMHIERDGDGPRAGARIAAQLTAKLGRRGIARAGSHELLVEPWPQGASEGEVRIVEVQRGSWPERGRPRLAKARPTQKPARPAPTAAELLQARGASSRPGWPDWLAEEWENAFAQAGLGIMPFAGGELQLTPTPALVAIDVDGAAVDASVALQAVARAIALWGLGGNIVVDLPGTDAPARARAAAAFDSAMAVSAPTARFERTAINGFGLLQIVCARRGASILERAWFDRAGTAAIAILRDIAASSATGPIRIEAPASVCDWLQARAQLLPQLAAQTHRPLDAQPLIAT